MSVRDIAQLVRHGKTVKIAKPVLGKIVACKDTIFNKQFWAHTIYHQILIFVDRFCDFSFTSYKWEFLTLFRMSFFGAAHGCGGGGGQKDPLSLKSVTHILQ